jgi:hypothetical protein
MLGTSTPFVGLRLTRKIGPHLRINRRDPKRPMDDIVVMLEQWELANFSADRSPDGILPLSGGSFRLVPAI